MSQVRHLTWRRLRNKRTRDPNTCEWKVAMEEGEIDSNQEVVLRDGNQGLAFLILGSRVRRPLTEVDTVPCFEFWQMGIADMPPRERSPVWRPA